MRADLNGTGPRTILSSPLVISPVAMAVDPIGAKLYWAEDQSFDDRIRRANLDGTGEQTIVSFVNVGDPVGVALDGTLADQPPALLADPTGITKNRYVSMQVVGGATVPSAVRLTLVALPAPFNAWNGATLWVTEAGPACEVGAIGPGQPCPAGAPTYTAAKLGCTPECRSDWSRLGTIHVSHEGIIPGATYRAEIADCATDLNDPANFLTPLDLSTPRWGDAVGGFVAGSWTGPNGVVEIVTDVVADLDKFGNRAGAPIKSRADLEPACVDGKVNITDVIRMLDAFRGLLYPFTPSAAAPCASLCP
jgi:hypothetical protein